MKKILIFAAIFILSVACSGKEDASSTLQQAYPITAEILSISEKAYDDVTIARKTYKQKGFTQVFMRIKIISVGRSIKGGASGAANVTFKRGQVVDVYAYKDIDFIGSKLLYKADIIMAEIVAVPLGDKSFSYKLSRLRKQ